MQNIMQKNQYSLILMEQIEAYTITSENLARQIGGVKSVQNYETLKST